MAYWIFALGILTGGVFANPHPRIIGGEDTTVEKYPAIVQVEFMNQNTGVWIFWCGANILTSRTILSAAHCFLGSEYFPQVRRIRAGSTYQGTGGQVHYVLQVFNHPSYNQASFMDGDINVVRLMTPLVYSPVVAQTAIPPQGSIIPDNLPVIYAGWGETRSVGGQHSDVLQHVGVYTVNNTLCKELYGAIPITKNMLCAGLVGIGGKDACGGDSGGPLYYGNITIGVVSFGRGCADAAFPGVNAAVASFSDWIVANTV